MLVAAIAVFPSRTQVLTSDVIDVAGTELWEFSYTFGDFQDGWALHDIEIRNGRGAIGFNNALLEWDGVSVIGPIGPSDGGGLGFSTAESRLSLC